MTKDELRAELERQKQRFETVYGGGGRDVRGSARARKAALEEAAESPR